MSLAGLYLALGLDEFESTRQKPPSFDDYKPAREAPDPLERFAPGPHNVAAILEMHSGRPAQKKAVADSFDSDCIPETPRSLEQRLEKRTPSAPPNIRYEKQASGVTFAYDERNQVVAVWAAGVEPNLERP